MFTSGKILLKTLQTLLFCVGAAQTPFFVRASKHHPYNRMDTGGRVGVIDRAYSLPILQKQNPVTPLSRKKYIFIGALMLSGILLSGCSSSPRVSTQSAPGVDITHYKTFAFLSPLGTDHDKYGTLLSQTLKSATRGALEAKGLTYSEKSPDMLINFKTTVKQVTDVDSMPDAGMMYPWRSPWYSPWGGYSDVDVRQYDDGTLLVDIVDAKKKEMIWEGTAKSIVHDDPNVNTETLKQSITALFEQFPTGSKTQ